MKRSIYRLGMKGVEQLNASLPSLYHQRQLSMRSTSTSLPLKTINHKVHKTRRVRSQIATVQHNIVCEQNLLASLEICQKLCRKAKVSYKHLSTHDFPVNVTHNFPVQGLASDLHVLYGILHKLALPSDLRNECPVCTHVARLVYTELLKRISSDTAVTDGDYGAPEEVEH
jgi:hypothetical protein